MSNLRASKAAYQAQLKSAISSDQKSTIHNIEEKNDFYGLHHSSGYSSAVNQLEQYDIEHENVQENWHSCDQVPEHTQPLASEKQSFTASWTQKELSKVTQQPHETHHLPDSSDHNTTGRLRLEDSMNTHHGDHSSKTLRTSQQPRTTFSHHRTSSKINSKTENENKVHLDNKGDNDKKKINPEQGTGIGVNSETRMSRNNQVESLSDLLSAAAASFSSLSLVGNTTNAIEGDENNELSAVGESLGLSTISLQSVGDSDIKSEGSLPPLGAPEGNISKQMASALRTANVSDLLSELTATVSQVRRNSANGQDMTLQLRSDILEDTSIHINANTAQMQVAFSTTSATSNALLNAHLLTLQNHLAALCPGQSVEVKNQFLTSSHSSEFNNGQNEGDDFAGFNQENRGNLRNRDETL